jgi:hypothetical protein
MGAAADRISSRHCDDIPGFLRSNQKSSRLLQIQSQMEMVLIANHPAAEENMNWNVKHSIMESEHWE